MAHIRCNCGNDLWDGTGEIVYDVYSKIQLLNYIKSDKKQEFTINDAYQSNQNIDDDFLNNHPHFWLCNNCKRIHLWKTVDDKEVYVRYRIADNIDNKNIETISSMSEYYAWNINEYDMIEDIKIRDLINMKPLRNEKYYVSSDMKRIYILDYIKKIIDREYIIEFEDYNDYNLSIKSDNDKMIYTITKTTQEPTYKYVNGKRILISEDKWPITQINHMITKQKENGSVRYADSNKTEVYDKNMNSLISDKKIIVYNLNGSVSKIKNLDEESLKGIHGMKIKCTLKNKTSVTGFSEVYRNHDNDYDGEVHDYINLWTWDNLDEKNHELIGNDDTKYNQTFIKVNIEDIVQVEAIMHTNPRWGGRLTNKFEFKKMTTDNDNLPIPSFFKKNKDELNKKYLYVYVEYEDMIGDKLYCYQTNDESIKNGDRVLVDRAGHKTCARVITTKYFSRFEVPYPIDKTKKIISKISKRIDQDYEYDLFNKNVILNYKLNDAWDYPIWEITIFDNEINNIEIKSDKITNGSCKITIPKNDIDKIKNIIIANKVLFDIKTLPSLHRVLDGTINKFFFQLDKKQIKLKSYNIWDYKNILEKPKSITVMFRVIDDINAVLKRYEIQILLYGEKIV